jgi:hypothetical protein
MAMPYNHQPIRLGVYPLMKVLFTPGTFFLISSPPPLPLPRLSGCGRQKKKKKKKKGKKEKKREHVSHLLP